MKKSTWSIFNWYTHTLYLSLSPVLSFISRLCVSVSVSMCVHVLLLARLDTTYKYLSSCAFECFKSKGVKTNAQRSNFVIGYWWQKKGDLGICDHELYIYIQSSVCFHWASLFSFHLHSFEFQFNKFALFVRIRILIQHHLILIPFSMFGFFCLRFVVFYSFSFILENENSQLFVNLFFLSPDWFCYACVRPMGGSDTEMCARSFEIVNLQ